MTSGEGGALVTNDPQLQDAAWSLHNVGRVPGGEWYEHPSIGWNLRLTEFQAALLLEQLTSLDEYIKQRQAGATYLRSRLSSEIEGIEPLHVPTEVTVHAWHLFVLRFDPSAFHGMSRDKLVEALLAEGIPCSSGYSLLNHHPAVLREIRDLRGSGEVMPDPCPAAESLVDMTFWLPQNVLLGSEEDIEDVVRALSKIQRI